VCGGSINRAPGHGCDRLPGYAHAPG
jgi:hypothetical protein